MGTKAIIIEQLIAYGVKFILDEIVLFMSTMIKYNHKHQLTVSQMLDFSSIHKESIPIEVRANIADYKYKLKCIIAGIAAKIEEVKYQELNDSIQGLQLMDTEKSKVMSIYNSERRISLSFQTLSVVIELFTQANNILKERINDPTGKPAFEEINYRLQNSILVFELLNFTINFIEKFKLKGRTEMMNVKKRVFEDISSIEKRIESEMIGKLEDVSEITKISVEEDIDNYKEILALMKDGWAKIDEEIKKLYESTQEYKALINDLKMYRTSVGVNIDIIALTAITRIVNQNVALIKNIHHFKTDMLVSFTPFDYCRLIGKV